MSHPLQWTAPQPYWRTGQAAIAPHGDGALALRQGVRAKGFTQALGQLIVQGGRHHAADVVGFEDGGCHLHGKTNQKPSGWVDELIPTL